MSTNVPAALMWDKRPLTEVKDGDYVPVNDFSLMTRTHPSQVHEWLKGGNLTSKPGMNGNRQTTMIKVLPISKMAPLLRDCGMSDKKLAVFEDEGYATGPAKKKPGRKPKAKPKHKAKLGPFGPKVYNKPGPKPGSKRKLKLSLVLAGSSSVNQYIAQSEEHGLDIKAYVALIDGAVKVGIVAAV